MFLHEQLAEWDWNPSMGVAFWHLKAWICQTLFNATLVYYDWSKPAVVQMDTNEFQARGHPHTKWLPHSLCQ